MTSPNPASLPPESATVLGVERALIGSIIVGSPKTPPPLEPDDFSLGKNQTAWAAIRSLYAADGVIDLPSLTHHLAVNGLLDEAGGAEYLALCVEDGMAAVHVDTYAIQIREDRRRRGLQDILATATAKGETPEGVRARIAALPPALDAAGVPSPNVWDTAKTIDELLAVGATEIIWLDYPCLACGHVTKVFAPRGTGKSLHAMYHAVRLARTGLRVLYIDRDNSPQLAVKRAMGFGAAGVPTFHLMTRKTAPPLKKAQEWAKLAQQEYDLVVIDSWDSFAEGSGEASEKAAPAMAPLLDLARGDHGPAVWILGNTTKSASHGRGSGILNDRLDIEFEARDITGWKPSGERPWHEEMPDGGVDFWATRATRRQRKDVTKIRLAFVSTKFRLEGDDPAPFAVEIDSSKTPWVERDITDELVAAGDQALTAAMAERQASLDAATAALKAEILRRAAAGEPLILKKEAEAFLQQSKGLKRKVARDLLSESTAWTFLALDKKSMAIVLPSPPALRTAEQVRELTLRGLMGPGPGKFPSGEPCGFIGCVLHPKILTTTAAFSREESPLEPRLPEDPNAADRIDTGRPYSESRIPAKNAPSSEEEMRPPSETKNPPDGPDGMFERWQAEKGKP